MIRSKIAMGFPWGLLALALNFLPGIVVPAHGQGTRKDDIVFNSRGTPLAGATVRVCAMPASGQPCSPLALIYSDAALTQALANPTTTDGLGNYFFYAAPGKYEIEISGPAITTKQIPNVILPNDPSSPTFSGISAFSLNLSGNLTVNGNTTVVGNLASGTLNLSNQSAPPGAASSGTVNLYTKTADKRLYYKDDTGTESGPLGAGAQTNAINTFTANQNLDSGLHIKGPDPYNDMARFGGYYNASPPSTTASCTSGSPNITLAAALDFKDATSFPAANLGNGIVIYKCGAPSGLSTPPAYTVTPIGLTGGSTTYNYQVVAEDFNGGLTAASPVGTTTVGAASLGLNNVTLASAVWNNTANGEQVYTCSGNCNIPVNTPLSVQGFTNSHFNGNYTTIAATATTFTVYSPAPNGYAVTSETAAGTATVAACNVLSMNTFNVITTGVETGGDKVVRWWVYRNGSILGAVQGRDSYYDDCGVTIAAGNIPSYVPSSPGSAVNKYLATTILSGAGTTSIVVANNAGATTSGQTVKHDNSQNLRACMAASAFSTPCYMNVGTGAPFEAATIFDTGNTHLLFTSVGVNQPWVIRSGGTYFEGIRLNGAGSFIFNNVAVIGGAAFPLVEILPLASGYQFDNISFSAPQLQQTAFVADSGSFFGLVMNRVSFGNSNSNSNVNIPPARLSGATESHIGQRGNQNACSAAQLAVGPPCIRFTTQSQAAGGNAGTFTAIGSMDMWGFAYQGGGASIQVDSLPLTRSGGSNSSLTGVGPLLIGDFLREIGKGPLLRLAYAGPGMAIRLERGDDDAPNAAVGNGLIDAASNEGGKPTSPNVDVYNFGTSVNGQVVLAGPGTVRASGSGIAVGTTLSATPPVGGYSTYDGGSILTSGAGTGIQAAGISALGYAMPQPNAPTVNVSAHSSCASNCVAAGTYFYAIVANDVNGRNSVVSPPSASVTTDGTQIITVSWVPVGGQVITSRGRGPAANNILLTDSIGTGVGGTSYTDLGSLSYSASLPQSSSANSSSLGSAGLATTQIVYTNSGFADTIGGILSANRTQTVPDVTGYIPVTGYVNSAYDNATRANGGIGVNWTLEQNGLNITSNQIQGTSSAGSNTAYWNANTFSAVQFAQATITALNGTTDFPGVTVLASGSGGSSTYYDCVENSTTIFIQRVVNAGTTNLTSTASAGAVGDLLRLEVAQGGVLTCFKNGTVALTATDTQIASGSPGLLISGNVATEKNWSGGNLHPLAQLDSEQDWTKTQHYIQGVAFGTETLTASPRAEQNVFLPGTLTSTWTGATWTTDKALTITRIQVQAKTAPAGCTTNAVVRLTDGTTPVNVTISAAANDSGAISQNYPAASSLQILVQTPAAGCTTSPADANVTVQYRMQ
ncbi:MAG TPA: hypothetical protein VFN26_12565 [Candidatus Acidoferrum sp.]|nr:hypothetical protein [Candidatus Acidoferrum sp.]